MSHLTSEYEDSAVSGQFQLKNVNKPDQSSSMTFVNQGQNPLGYMYQAPTYSRVGLASNMKVKSPKYYSLKKIEQASPKVGTKKPPCGNEKCRICKKLKPVPDKKYLEFLSRRKIKAPLPALPSIKPIKRSQQQIHLHFDNNNTKQGRKVKSVIEPEIHEYIYHPEERPSYKRIRHPWQRKYYTEEQEEPAHKYVSFNGKMYQIIEQEDEERNVASLPSVSHRKLKSVKSILSPISTDRQSWRIRHQQLQKQREQLNKLAQKYIKYQTMFFQLRVDGQSAYQPTTQKKSKQPQKMTLYRLKEEVSQQKIDLFQTIYDRQLSKNIENKAQQEQQTEIYNIKFPTVSQIQSSISNYQSLTGQFNIEVLKKSKNYFREYSDESGKQFLYFGGFDSQRKQRKGFGVLVTKKCILEGIWMKNFIIKGAELKMNSLYKGEFSNNKRHGQGTCKWLNGEQYMGQWSNGLRSGQGYWSSKDNKETYSGEWKNGKVFGYGQYYKKDVSFYKGSFQNFVKNGFGAQQFNNGDKFEGKYVNGVPQGYGVYVWSCGLKYEGLFNKGEREGKGRLLMANTFQLDGMFQKERPHGICQLKLKNKDVFNGKYVYGEKYGYGKLQNNQTGISKQGFWNHGMLQQKIESSNKQAHSWE